MKHRTFAFADLHGIYDLWKQIKEFASPHDTLIFLGDAIDRGPDGIKILQEMLDDPRVIYICGNHEEMFIDSWNDYLGMQLWKMNGGNKTRKGLMKLPHQERVRIRNKIMTNTKDFHVYYNENGQRIFLTHSGFTPELNKEPFSTKWNREHIKDKWNQEEELKDIIIVHGHTISWTLNKYDNKINKENAVAAIRYCDGHKIDIDMGSAFTGRACLLDLDTLEPIYFDIENFDKTIYFKYVNENKRIK